MQKVGLLENMVPSATTPTDLYNLLGEMGSSAYQGGTPLLNQRINTKGLRFSGTSATQPTKAYAKPEQEPLVTGFSQRMPRTTRGGLRVNWGGSAV